MTGGPELRVTTIGYDASGNAISRTEGGVEAGAAFTLTTTTAFEAAGEAMSVDPPGFGTDDVTSFTYDPARGGLVVATRSDPLIGTELERLAVGDRVRDRLRLPDAVLSRTSPPGARVA